jgi:hypothetical protein
MTLWAKLESMEQEQRFNGDAYPVGMVPFPFRLQGQGFFPGGDGLWRDEGHICESGSGKLEQNGIVFLGNDFGTLAGYKKLQRNGYENVPTWRHIKKRVVAAQLPVGASFFTNTILGLRAEGTALTKRAGRRCRSSPSFVVNSFAFSCKPPGRDCRLSWGLTLVNRSMHLASPAFPGAFSSPRIHMPTLISGLSGWPVT